MDVETHIDTTGDTPHIALELMRLDVAHHLFVGLVDKEGIILPQGADQLCHVILVVSQQSSSKRTHEGAILDMSLLDYDSVPAM